MKPFNIAILAALALALAGARAPVLASAPAAPAATARLSGDTMALGVGYGWGRGVLSYQGRDTPFTITGVSLVGLGADRVEGVAEVYNLRRLDDFAGLYGVAGRNGAFVTIGGGAAVLRNAKGVEIRLRTQNQGLKIAVAAGGANIALR